MPKFTELGESMAGDDVVLRHLARISAPGLGGMRKAASLRTLALEAGVGEAKVALSMKYAVKNGLARRSGPRAAQHAWVCTPKGDAHAKAPPAREPVPMRLEPKGHG